MTAAVRQLIATFDRVAIPDKQAVAAEILRRSDDLRLPPLSDGDLVTCAEEVFLELDRCEAADEEPAAR